MLSGTNGKVLFRGLLACAVYGAIIGTINVWTRIHEWDQSLNPIEPVIWEATSIFTFVLFAGLAFIALQIAPLSTWRSARFYAVHLAAFVLLSAGHIGGFLLLRDLIYWLAGAHYCCTTLQTALDYESLKDFASYVMLIGLFWVAARLSAEPKRGTAPGTYDIRDGAHLVRVPMSEILAVSSAGNYVEFVLRDGRRPLMRKPLSAMEVELSASGFVRTHRSWLVNAMQVTGLKPEGSGDYEIEVGNLCVPLSRRFPEALAKLRAG